MNKVLFYKKNNRVFRIYPSNNTVYYDKKTWSEIIVDNVPALGGENHSLYVENGKVVSKIDTDKVVRLERETLLALIAKKKALLVKYREDVEQVDLFGMERADYAEKKAACKTLVEELRALEKELRS